MLNCANAGPKRNGGQPLGYTACNSGLGKVAGSIAGSLSSRQATGRQSARHRVGTNCIVAFGLTDQPCPK